MRSILAWIIPVAFGVLFTGLLPSPALAQQREKYEWGQAQIELGIDYLTRTDGDRADNMEKGIAAFEAALTVATREALPSEWAVTQNNLGMAYRDRIRGDRADNLEKAIAAHEAALTVTTREALPRDWADTQNNLALAYRDRIRGDRADNLEKAIAAFEARLTVTTREAAPRDWAETQSNLGIAYWDRVRGDRAGNLEKAIAAFEAALTVRTREALPRDWAVTQNNLGMAYENRVRGDRANNMEKAITAYEAALTVLTREELPREWAQTQASLGIVYWNRVRGNRADNMEKAIAAYEAALTVRTRQALPSDWAATQNNLGVAYETRIRGDRADNMEKAIAAYEAVLTVRTREALPRDWAMAQNNLGNAYRARIRGDQADNLEKAIAAFEAALTVMTCEALPRDCAGTQTNLGLAYRARIRGDRADNLEKAIAAYEAALIVRTREELPREWAATQASLGVAYQDRIRGNRAENLEKAIAAYEAALTVRTRQALPRDHLVTARALGGARLQARTWPEAALAYANAREAFLVLFGQGLDEADVRDLIAEAGPLFGEAAFAAMQLGENEKALALVAEGRARLLAAALKLQRLDLPEDKRKRLNGLQAEIRAADRMVEAAHGAQRTAAVEKLAGLRQELLGLIRDADAAEAARRGSPLAQARAVAGESAAVLVPVVTKVGGKVLIVTGRSNGVGPSGSHTAITPIDLPELTTDRLNAVTGRWLLAYAVNYLAGDELNRRWPEWLSAVDSVGTELWRLVGGRLNTALKEAGIQPGGRIVWLPTDALGILPLGLAQDPASKRRLMEDYEIVYAPSLDALTMTREQLAEAASAPTLAVVVNPLGDLPGAEKEGKLVASYFPAQARTVQVRSKATPEAVLAALKGKTYWHFASHGTFSWDDARQSGLYMSGRKVLTVGRLLETNDLGRPRLVVLSACETGLYDIKRSPDEFIGLPGAFTALGAAGVLSTLWPVDDTATALLIAKFYELHLGTGLSPPAALRRAQLWLRHATNWDLQAYARGAARQGRLESRHLSDIEAKLSEEGLTHSRNAATIQWVAPAGRDPGGKRSAAAKALARPYGHPYYWAGFIYTGL